MSHRGYMKKATELYISVSSVTSNLFSVSQNRFNGVSITLASLHAFLEQPKNLPIGIQAHVEGCRVLREAGHSEDIASKGDNKAGSVAQLKLADGDAEVLRAAA